jgi:hypothetical protein
MVKPKVDAICTLLPLIRSCQSPSSRSMSLAYPSGALRPYVEVTNEMYCPRLSGRDGIAPHRAYLCTQWTTDRS